MYDVYLLKTRFDCWNGSQILKPLKKKKKIKKEKKRRKLQYFSLFYYLVIWSLYYGDIQKGSMHGRASLLHL